MRELFELEAKIDIEFAQNMSQNCDGHVDRASVENARTQLRTERSRPLLRRIWKSFEGKTGEDKMRFSEFNMLVLEYRHSLVLVIRKILQRTVLTALKLKKMETGDLQKAEKLVIDNKNDLDKHCQAWLDRFPLKQISERAWNALRQGKDFIARKNFETHFLAVIETQWHRKELFRRLIGSVLRYVRNENSGDSKEAKKQNSSAKLRSLAIKHSTSDKSGVDYINSLSSNHNHALNTSPVAAVYSVGHLEFDGGGMATNTRTGPKTFRPDVMYHPPVALRLKSDILVRGGTSESKIARRDMIRRGASEPDRNKYFKMQMKICERTPDTIAELVRSHLERAEALGGSVEPGLSNSCTQMQPVKKRQSSEHTAATHLLRPRHSTSESSRKHLLRRKPSKKLSGSLIQTEKSQAPQGPQDQKKVEGVAMWEALAQSRKCLRFDQSAVDAGSRRESKVEGSIEAKRINETSTCVSSQVLRKQGDSEFGGGGGAERFGKPVDNLSGSMGVRPIRGLISRKDSRIGAILKTQLNPESLCKSVGRRSALGLLAISTADPTSSSSSGRWGTGTTLPS